MIVKSYLMGEEKLWKAYWLAGLFGGPVFFMAVGFLVGSSRGPFGLAFSLFTAYCIWWSMAIWNCAFNARWKGWGYAARASIVLGILAIIFDSGRYLLA